MRDHPVRSKLRHGYVAISKVDGYHRDAGGPGGLDVRARIPDHDRPFPRAARGGDGLKKRLGVRLANAERVLTADEGETVSDPKLCHEQLGQALDLVGADRLPPARPCEAREGLVDARIKPGAVCDVVAVIAKVVDEQNLNRLRVKAPARSGKAVLDQRPRAGPNPRTRAFNR